MLKVDVPKWLERLRRVPWSGLEVEFDDYVVALKEALPELAEYIDKKVAKLTEDAGGGVQLFITLEQYKDTGEWLAFEIAIAGDGQTLLSPDHIHNRSPDADYGEKIWTLAGGIFDVPDRGQRAIWHTPTDDPIVHGPETRHQPKIEDYWLGIFYQPAGSRSAE